jgi:ATP-dependent DNA helicase RecG
MTVGLDSRLDGVIGGKAAAAVQRAFGIRSVGELLAHYPRRHALRGDLTPIDSLVVGEQVTIVAQIETVSERPMQQRRGSVLEVTITDGRGRLALTFFNQGWRTSQLRPGRRGIFSGKVGEYQHHAQLAHPDYELFDDAADLQENARSYAQTPIPLYPATSSLPSWRIGAMISQTLDVLGEVADPIPPAIRSRHDLIPLREALEGIHRPRTADDIGPALRTLRWQEAFVLQAALLQQRDRVRALTATARPPGALLDRFEAALGFALTADQVTVGAVIAHELADSRPMNRLVQGEVGSGKTLVALRAMLQVAETGGQSALIAPTEVLAAQHLRALTAMLGPQLSSELMPTLLTGQMGVAERRRAGLRVASGQARIVVGTHALLSESTVFADLGLVVVDEQHRFGVEQREMLRAKGTAPHVLVLTATPIPRTVAMTVFGDLDVSTIRTLPSGRAAVATFVTPLAERPAWFARVWERAAEEAESGHQVFVVCPVIDADAAAPDADGPAPAGEGTTGARWGVAQVERMLADHPRFRELTVRSIHGRMSSEDKDAIMRAFAAGTIDVLVATTVIEVGVDVPNASAMIVMDADRFGVSQLHQLRGRIGRGSVPGVCLLVTQAPPDTPARARVEAVAATGDGFALAEIDLELRGEGDVLGPAQSGARSSLRLLRVVQDAELIERARAEAAAALGAQADPADRAALADAIERRLDGAERAALSKS